MKHIPALALTAAALTLIPLANAEPKPATVKPYPLNTCVVSGEKLGDMGTAYVFTNGNRQIKLCCEGCLKQFNKDSAKYLKQLDAADKAKVEKATAPADNHSGHHH